MGLKNKDKKTRTGTQHPEWKFSISNISDTLRNETFLFTSGAVLTIAAIFMLVATFTSVALFSSCSESKGDEVDEYADWQKKNDTYFNKVYTEAEQAIKSGKKDWKILTAWSINGASAQTTDHIVVKVLKEGTGSGCPIFTDNAYVHYIGHLIPSVSYPKGYLFDKSTQTEELSLASDKPSLLALIPYQLGYKGVAKTGIPAYSTLIFDIYLCQYFRDDDYVIIWKAKEGTWIEE